MGVHTGPMVFRSFVAAQLLTSAVLAQYSFFQARQGYPQQSVNTFPLSAMGPYNQQFAYAAPSYIPQPMTFQPVAGIQVTNTEPMPYGNGGEIRFSPQFGDPKPPTYNSVEQFQKDQRAPFVQRESPQPQVGPTRIIPPFLASATKEEQDKFYSIVQHPSWSATAKNEKIEEFMRTMDTEKQASYAEWDGRWSSEAKTRRQKVHNIVDQMSQEAKIQFQKVSALMTAPGMTENERLQRIQELYAKIPASVRKEFDEKLVNF